jgi:hypothetical protein
MSEQNGEFEGILEPMASRPVMSKPPRMRASMKLVREVSAALGIDDDAAALDAADWVADKMERFGARTARPVFGMDGEGPQCSWCSQIWPLCGCHHLSAVEFNDDEAADK